eukprot:14713701-Alexandrium_andersonii.AAC.1
MTDPSFRLHAWMFVWLLRTWLFAVSGDGRRVGGRGWGALAGCGARDGSEGRFGLRGGVALLQGVSLCEWHRGRPPSAAASCQARGTVFGLVGLVLVLECRVACAGSGIRVVFRMFLCVVGALRGRPW